MRIILSVPGARKYSLIQWLEFPTLDAEEPEPRTVYIMDSAPIGRTLGVGLVHTCLPLPHSVKSRPPHRKRKARCSPAARKMTS